MLLRVENLKAGYGNKVVISDVSFALEPGQIMAFFGHNGAGKTTTIKTILGLIRCIVGGLWLDGEPIGTMSVADRVARGLRLLPDAQGVFADLRVAANLDVVAERNCKKGESRINIDDVLRLFPILAERRNSLAGTMSGGQQRMLSVSLAILGSPRCLLLDEPSLGLQPDVVEHLFTLVRKICKEQGMCVVIVENNVAATMKIADHVVIMNNGRIVFDGLPAAAQVSDFWQYF
jgi:ABC-type branched-subunit amino acid transport system ATPase component